MKHVLAVIAYVVGTLATQATSHFLIFKQHYDLIAFNRPDPIFALGIGSMIIQGAILSYVYANSRFWSGGLKGAVLLSLLFGAFLVSYEGMAEAAKYAIPDIGSWIGVEALSGAVQYALIGALLYFAHYGVAHSAAK